MRMFQNSEGVCVSIPASQPLYWSGPEIFYASDLSVQSSLDGKVLSSSYSPHCTCPERSIIRAYPFFPRYYNWQKNYLVLYFFSFKQKGDLPLCTNHGAESFRAFERVGKVDPATVFTCQLGFLLFFCVQENSINRRHSKIIYLLI